MALEVLRAPALPATQAQPLPQLGRMRAGRRAAAEVALFGPCLYPCNCSWVQGSGARRARALAGVQRAVGAACLNKHSAQLYLS